MNESFSTHGNLHRRRKRHRGSSEDKVLSPKQLVGLFDHAFKLLEQHEAGSPLVEISSCSCEGLQGVAWMPKDTPFTLHQELEAFAAYVRLQRREVKARLDMIDTISECVKQGWPAADVRVFGSFDAQLSTFLSDVDLSISTGHMSSNTMQPSIRTKEASKGASEPQVVWQFEDPDSSDDDDDDETSGTVGWFTDRSKSDVTVDADDVWFNLKGALPSQSLSSESPSFNPTRHVPPTAKLATLQRLHRLLLRTCPSLATADFRRGARVPIIHVTHHNGLECDVSVDEAASDTSRFVQALAGRYPEFLPLAVVLKVFLWQQRLDKPFTGGIGSFRLYVMLAYLLENLKEAVASAEHTAWGRSSDAASHVEDLGTLFVAFLQYYSQPENLNRETVLSTHGLETSFESATQLERCVQAFGQAFERLTNQLRHFKGPGRVFSYLATFIAVKELEQERNKRSTACSKQSLESLKSNRRQQVGTEILRALLRVVGSTSDITLDDVCKWRPALASALLSFQSLEHAQGTLEAVKALLSSAAVIRSKKRKASRIPSDRFITEPIKRAKKQSRDGKGQTQTRVRVARLTGNGIIGEKIRERFKKKSRR